jgi:hypothetical protein
MQILAPWLLYRLKRNRLKENTHSLLLCSVALYCLGLGGGEGGGDLAYVYYTLFVQHIPCLLKIPFPYTFYTFVFMPQSRSVSAWGNPYKIFENGRLGICER